MLITNWLLATNVEAVGLRTLLFGPKKSELILLTGLL